MKTKNKKSKKQRKLLLALLMLLLTFITLSTSTYAWFTANKTVTVSTINVNVAAANGLQISVDGLEWKSVITNEDIIGAVNTYPTAKNQLPSNAYNLAPVSSAGLVDGDGLMQMFLGEVGSDNYGNYNLTATKSTEANGTEGNFIAFDLFFQVQKETTLYLTDNASVAALATANSGIQNAARVAFINEGNTPAGSAAGTIQALKAANATPVIWEPNYDVHTEAAVAHAKNTYGVDTTTESANLLAYYGIKADITTAVALNSIDGNYFAAVTPNITTKVAGINANAYEQVLTIPAGISKIRIYMWIEGQDVDCENMASGGSVNFNLQISSSSSANAQD